MRSVPMLFSDPLVRALLAGDKFVTRRLPRLPKGVDRANLVSDSPTRLTLAGADGTRQHRPPARAGDTLWVRECFRYDRVDGTFGADRRGRGTVPATVRYRADGSTRSMEIDGQRLKLPLNIEHWIPAMFMPSWASRAHLPLANVRAERLQDITAADVAAEGVVGALLAAGQSPIEAFRALWDQLNRDVTTCWAANPIVWRIEWDPSRVEVLR